MPKFLSAQQLYRCFQRELPEGVYPDAGSASAFFSTASVYAKAKTIETLYSTSKRVYDNEFPQYADERIDDWEIKVFGQVQNAGLSLSERQSLIIAKLRKKPQIALWEILTLVAAAVPVGTFVQIVEWGCNGHGGGSWIIGKSRLGIDTILGWGLSSALNVVDLDFCSAVVTDGWRLGASHLGLNTKLSGTNSWQVISAAQIKAYTYEVRIFEYALTGDALAQLMADLTQFEPARSGHIVIQNQSLTGRGLTVSVTNVDQFSGISCITRDPISTTGYSGRKTVNG